MFEKFSLEGKVAVVTGGGTGIGKAIALNMAKVGANIVVAARRLTPLEETKAEIEDIGRNAMAIQTDVTNFEQVNNLFSITRTVSLYSRDSPLKPASRHVLLFIYRHEL